jgi:hypothetical protein
VRGVGAFFEVRGVEDTRGRLVLLVVEKDRARLGRVIDALAFDRHRTIRLRRFRLELDRLVGLLLGEFLGRRFLRLVVGTKRRGDER